MTRKSKYDYNTDFYAWAMHTAKLIRAHKISEIDFENVAEEIESVGNSERHELVNRFAILICHLLKWQYQPGKRGSSWRRTIIEQRTAIELLLEDSPSLCHELESRMLRSYGLATVQALRETGFPDKAFPASCPYSLKQVTDHHFFPEEA